MGVEATTIPSPTTSAAAGRGTQLGIRWVHPHSDATVTVLGDRELVLGRGAECDVELPGRELSRRHALIRRAGPVHVIVDAGSRNGVHLQGVRVAGEAALAPGQVLRLGDVIGVVGRDLSSAGRFHRAARHLLVGPVLDRLLEPLERAAQSDLCVVIEGETGTGKECVARALHDWSGRAGPFVAVNCSELPEALAEAELFGYRRGAFTGAVQASEGRIRAASGGTLFLDEITDWPLTVQAKLLRVLEQREVIPIGESRGVPLDVRILVAAQEPLERAVAGGRLRADLRYRLEETGLKIPPLRERVEDTPFLFRELCREHAGGKGPELDPRLIEQLCLYDMPGNVRELDKIARSLVVLHAHEGRLKRSHLPERCLRSAEVDSKSERPPAGGPSVERLLRAVRQHDGVIARAAAALGISRQSAYRLLEKQGLDPDVLRRPAAREGDDGAAGD